MSELVELLKKPYDSPYDFETVKPKKKYSEPKIYTGGVAVSRWNTLKKADQQQALSRQWYIYYSYRHPETGKLQRQVPIYGGANYYKTKNERMEILETYRRNLSRLLRQGYSPYEKSENAKRGQVKDVKSVEQAVDFALKIKEKSLGATSYLNFQSRIRRFEKYLIEKGYTNRFITSLDKKVVTTYLNSILATSSPRNRNNTRTDLSALFQVLEDNDIIAVNFIRRIPVLKSEPNRNKTYSNKQVEAIYEYLQEENPHLLLFIKFVSYNFLRPVEVCRLRVGDINLEQKTLSVKAKNKAVKRKIIPEMLLRELPDFSEYNADDFLFTPEGHPGKWDTAENNKRDFFSKRFNRVKKHFGLGKEYGIYSFRHTFITKLYQEMRKELTPFETKSKLMLITGHSTMTALEKYLRDIDAELPEDYSDLLE